MEINPEPGEDILEVVAGGVSSTTEHLEEMGRQGQPENWRCSASGRPKCTKWTMVSGTSRLRISRARWSGERCLSEHERPQVYPPNYQTVSIERLG